MELRRRELFTTIRTEGAILPPDLLQRVASGDSDLGGLKPTDYHLFEGEPLNEAIVRSWNRLVGAWAAFDEARARLPEGDLGTTITRERWLLILFDELDYGRLQPARAAEIEGKSYAASHSWGEHVPVHLVGCNVPLDRRSQGVAGAAAMSPHGLVQELLNRSEERLWGFVSNGLTLRVLRDNSSLTRQAYVEFDLASMMDGEVYADFVVLWLVCHQSRVEGETPHECWLELWSQEAVKQGTRALDGLRSGVEAAITALGRGFLAQPANNALRKALRSGELDKQDYYRELLRLAYRLLFLFVAEDRGLLLGPGASEQAAACYDRFYSTRRLRRLAERRRGSKHADLYRGLRLVMEKLGDDAGCPALGLPALGGYLWSGGAVPSLGTAELPNSALLDAVRALATLEERGVRRAVDYRNLGAEELGSVYESLLELHPDLNVDAGAFALTTAAGNERKTTGSYYTPTSLISCLLDSALDPVLDEAAAKGEQAILDLKVCDPACGSGHFLVAAAHRIAKRLAAARTGDDEPSPEATRTALRDVVGRCLYGVDVNPMAVELCKVSLWMEALDPGRPLSFLDAHIKCGNSLLGTTAALIADGIPDEAFKQLGGDDKEIAKSLRKQNKAEREGQLTLEDATIDLIGALESKAIALEGADDATVDGLHAKERLFQNLVASEEYERAKLTADAWCAAFVQRKEVAAPRITTGAVRRLASGGAVPADLEREIRQLADRDRLFQWEVEFPHVFARNADGFDVVLGNPPWGQTEIAEKEFFSGHSEIAGARNAAQRKRLIADLEQTDPTLHAAWVAGLRSADGASHVIRSSGRYPLCGRGRVNTYSVFAELMRSIVSETGRIGCIVPTGIVTDDTTRAFASNVMLGGYLVSLHDFENKRGLFPDVAPVVKFCLLTVRGASKRDSEGDLCFFLLGTEDLADPTKHVELSAADISLVSPNSGTCPIFRSRRDAKLTMEIYRHVPVLVDESRGEPRNPWGVTFKQGLFNLASDSSLFRTREELESDGFALEGNVFSRGDARVLPLYEAKLFHQFNHRLNTYDGVRIEDRFKVKAPARALTSDELRRRDVLVTPRYWVDEKEVRARVGNGQKWHVAFRDMTNVMTNRRNAVFALLPESAIGHSAPVVFLASAWHAAVFMALGNCFAFDYLVRQRLAGGHLTFGILKQIPSPPPDAFEEVAKFATSESLGNWIMPRVIELTSTADDVSLFASDCGYPSTPYIWDEDRRSFLQNELDAAFFHLYGLPEEDVDYVMETFPIVKRRDEEKYGHYRTKALILDVYRKMADAVATGVPYETILDPPPADSRVAHPPRVQSVAAQTRL